MLHIKNEDNDARKYHARFNSHFEDIKTLYEELYAGHPKQMDAFAMLTKSLSAAHIERPEYLKSRDEEKEPELHWFLSNKIAGMSVYVDRFCGDLKNLEHKLPYFKKLGINLLHLMPLMQSPDEESDGGYSVSDFRKVDARFGTLEDLKKVEQKMKTAKMFLLMDIVFNHTSDQHEWALKAKAGDKEYQDYFYMYDHRDIPDQFDKTLPEIFPESAPGNFTYSKECNKWVMTIFHNYQWDLNYSNPIVFVEMLNTAFFYANLGVDILRIDAPAFIWKQVGTSCQNLPKAHTILCLLKLCVQVSTPGMVLLGEAIVAPKEIMKYFGSGLYTGKECDLAYNATHMALQWDALATGDTRVMLAAQSEILKKPFGTSWITYTRCHDDIGLAYDDEMIYQAGYDGYQHRKYVKNYYSGSHQGSPSRGALFSVNHKTQDARISGSLASLCGLEKAMEESDPAHIATSIDKILLMQAHSFFIGGIPMLFYGDEMGSINDYSFLKDPSKKYDNRWMHRPVFDWEKNARIDIEGTIEQRIFSGTQKLISIRKKLAAFSDFKNLTWIHAHNIHIAVYQRSLNGKNICCLFNFGIKPSALTGHTFMERLPEGKLLYDHWAEKYFTLGQKEDNITIGPYSFHILEAVDR